MAIETDSDIRAMLADWETAQIGAHTINGIFGSEYVEVNGVQSTQPTFVCVAADVPALAVDMPLVRAGDRTSYRVKAIQPDATGRVVSLVLERQQ